MEEAMPFIVNVPGANNMKSLCCGDWLKHWKKHTLSDPGICRACNKVEADVGGHVKLALHEDGKMFVVPMCHECSAKKTQKDKFFVQDKDLVQTGACFDDLDDICDTDDKDTEYSDGE